MITVYDMTSGTLRKELEAEVSLSERQSPAAMTEVDELTQLQLQEIDLHHTSAQANEMPASLAQQDIDEFIDLNK